MFWLVMHFQKSILRCELDNKNAYGITPLLECVEAFMPYNYPKLIQPYLFIELFHKNLFSIIKN